MYFKTLFACFASAVIGLAGAPDTRGQDNPPAAAASASQSSPSTADTAFVQQAAKGGIAEVDLSQIAVTAASTPELREFAKKMVDDHTANNRELASTAKQLGISVPKETDDEHVHLRQKLSTLRGPDFDKAYIAAMRTDHQKMVELLQYSAKTVHAPELHMFIDKTLPVVREHLAMAQKLGKK